MSEALIQAEHTADRVRSELLKTLEELDRRREAFTDWRAQANRFAPALWGAAAVVGALVAARIGYALYERRQWGSHKAHLRSKALRRAWYHPQQVARPSRRPLPAELAAAAVGSFAKVFAAQLAKRAVTTRTSVV